MLTVINAECHINIYNVYYHFFQKFVSAKCRYTEGHYKYLNTELHYDVYPYAECFYAERH
jgi:hypothetical protein